MSEVEMVQEVKKDKKAEKEKIVEDLPGVGSATAEKLSDAGYNTLMSIAVASPAELVEASGVGESVARKIINAARNSVKMGFESGEELLARRAKVIKLTTGSKAIDEMMGGGFESGAITECHGQFGSSKTQLAHQLAVCSQLPIEQGGCDGGGVVFIDTENTFRPERIKDMAEGLGLDFSEVLKNIKVARAFNSDHQMLLTEKIEDLITQDNFNVKLIVVDSLMAHFRSEFSGRAQLADRQQKLNKHMHTLLKIADMYNIVIYITNQVSSDPAAFFGDPTKPIGGNIVGHNSTFRIYLRPGKKGTKVAKLIDSPSLPNGEAIFKVGKEGIRDI